MKTRDRILHCSLDMFNHYGHIKVSTVEIANALEISPGNLYYHFNGKDQLLTELFYEYEAATKKLIEFYAKDVQIFEDYWAYLNIYIGLIQQYSFFYRDMRLLFAEDKLLKRRFMRVVNSHQSFFLKMLAALNERGELNMSEAQREITAETIYLLATNSLDAQMAEGEDYNLHTITKRIVMRIITIVEPYFTLDTRTTYNREFDPSKVKPVSLFKS